ncbi:MAG: hypothetical protein LBN24_11305 [Mediterranea sp.]|jgi:hypothetical protein|nr:hypothetical protein [Mediterranea sp.]
MITRITYITLILTCLALCHACTDKEGEGRTSVGGQECEVSLQLIPPFQTGVNTRAPLTAQEAEAAIHNVYLLVFDGKGKDTSKATFAYWRKAWNRGTAAAVANTYQSTLLAAEDIDIYIAVNIEETLLSSLKEDETWENLQQVLQLQTKPANIGQELSNNGLPMWGALLDRTIKPGDTFIQYSKVKLLRSVAAVNVGITAQDFVLKKGHIASAAQTGYLSYNPANGTEDSNGNLLFTKPNMPATVAYADYSYPLAQGETGIQNKFYLYENTVGAQETKLILEGSYKGGTSTFYPLAFHKTSDRVNKTPILRNTKFNIIITNVNGDGYSSLEDAKKGEEVNMEYKVVEWNEQTDDIFMDGSQYFSIDNRRDKVLMPRDKGAIRRLRFTTSYDLNDIQMQLKGGMAGSQKDEVTEHTRFDLQRVVENDPLGSPSNYFKVINKLDYDAKANDLTAIFEVSVGRLKFTITVTQTEQSDSGWDEGYDVNQEV